jgi:hypothetical protein
MEEECKWLQRWDDLMRLLMRCLCCWWVPLSGTAGWLLLTSSLLSMSGMLQLLDQLTASGVSVI